MFDIAGILLWVGLGAGGLALAFVEYVFSSKKKKAETH